VPAASVPALLTGAARPPLTAARLPASTGLSTGSDTWPADPATGGGVLVAGSDPHAPLAAAKTLAISQQRVRLRDDAMELLGGFGRACNSARPSDLLSVEIQREQLASQ
jgi:hypothetical protein